MRSAWAHAPVSAKPGSGASEEPGGRAHSQVVTTEPQKQSTLISGLSLRTWYEQESLHEGRDKGGALAHSMRLGSVAP